MTAVTQNGSLAKTASWLQSYRQAGLWRLCLARGRVVECPTSEESEAEVDDPDLKFDGTRVFSDTHPEIERRMIEGMRRLTPAQRIGAMSSMGRFMKGAAFAQVRRHFPDASERDCWMRVMSRSIPADLMLKAYGWDVREKGY